MEYYEIPGPPPEIRKKTRFQKVYGEIERIDTSQDKGVLTYIKGRKRPFKGYIYPEAVRASGTVKRVLKETVRLITSREMFWFFLPILFLPRFLKRKITKRWIEWFVNYSTRAFEPYRIKTERFCQSGREIYRVATNIAKDETEKEAVYNLCMVWEYDYIYRFIGQDIFGELDKKNLKNPRKELIRLADILLERSNNDGIEANIRRARKLVRFLPKWILNGVVRFLQELDPEEMKLDETDFYWCCDMPQYDFRGISYKSRKNLEYFF